MKRLFWLALGASAGVLLVRAARRRVRRLTPANAGEAVSGAVANLADGLRSFAEEIRAAAAEREAELVAALAVPDPAEGPGTAGATGPGAPARRADRS